MTRTAEAKAAWLVPQLLLMALVLAAGWFLRNPDGPPWVSVAGGLVMIAAIIPAVKGLWDLGRSLSPYPRPVEQGTLVTRGIYRHVRHPMYASLILLSFGWSVWAQSPVAVLGTAVFAWFLRRKAVCEERLLQQRYPAYAEYARGTGRFLPRWRNTLPRT